MPNEKAKKYEMDMCNGPILKKMLLFTLPLICSSILQLLFNAADIIVVGRFAGDNSLAAVGATGSLINLFVNFFIGLSVSANVLVARICRISDGGVADWYLWISNHVASDHISDGTVPPNRDRVYHISDYLGDFHAGTYCDLCHCYEKI